MMFHHGKNHFIPLFHKFVAKAGNKQVDAFRRSAGEDNFVRATGVNKLTHRFTGGLMQFRSLLRKIMHAAMHIGINGIIFIHQRINYQTGFLRRRTVIEINQRFTVNRTAQYRKILTYLLNIHVY